MWFVVLAGKIRTFFCLSLVVHLKAMIITLQRLNKFEIDVIVLGINKFELMLKIRIDKPCTQNTSTSYNIYK